MARPPMAAQRRGWPGGPEAGELGADAASPGRAGALEDLRCLPEQRQRGAGVVTRRR